jgi:hypothetical protein
MSSLDDVLDVGDNEQRERDAAQRLKDDDTFGGAKHFRKSLEQIVAALDNTAGRGTAQYSATHKEPPSQEWSRLATRRHEHSRRTASR